MFILASAILLLVGVPNHWFSGVHEVGTILLIPAGIEALIYVLCFFGSLIHMLDPPTRRRRW